MPKSEINDSLIDSIQGNLKYIGDFLKGCKLLSQKDFNPYEDAFKEIWTFVTSVLNEFTHLDEIVENTVRIVKYSLRILGRKFDKYLLPFL